MSTQTYAQVLSQAHSIIFLSDNMRKTLREVIRENGISPEKLMQSWDTLERGIQAWLHSGHLNNIVVLGPDLVVIDGPTPELAAAFP